MKDGILIDEWKITQREFCKEENRYFESIFSLSNEHMGLRGFFEEEYTGDTLKGVYTAGIYYPDKTRVGWWKNGYPEFFAKILNSTNWAGVRILLNGEELDLNTCSCVEFVRELDMRTAEYRRSFTVIDDEGRKTGLVFRRFLSMDDRSIACISIEVRPLNYDGSIEFRPYLDGNIKNEDSNYDEVFWDRLNETAKDTCCMLTMETKKTQFRHTCAMSNKVFLNDMPKPADCSRAEFKYVEQVFKVGMSIGDVLRLDKYVCVCTSRDIEKSQLESVCSERLASAFNEGIDKIFDKHVSIMKKKWQMYDIVIEGDIKAQQGIRYNIFQLMLTYSGNDSRLNIGPKGFTGEKYGGTTYWDTEAFCFPFYLYSDAEAARSLLYYRYLHLDMAKKNAKKLGLNGALYPMVTVDGQECHNEWEITFEEIHRNGAIAYAIYSYVKYTGDTEYLKEYGLEVLIELCRFWASRVTYNKRKDCYMILGVTGPNEYENNVNNNFYTNTMAAWTIEYTLNILGTLNTGHCLGLDEIELWRNIAHKMYYPRVKEMDIFEQNDLYMDKELVSADSIPENERPINQHWSWDKILRSCFIKQADVLQAMYFFPDKYSIEEQRRNFDFYEPKTVHESSLSASIHSIAASRIGYKKKAYELYLRTARLDLEDINNDSSDGLHITSMGATWAAVVQGFAGVDASEEGLIINPRLPESWSRLRFNLCFRGAGLKVSITSTDIEIGVSENSIKIAVLNKPYTLSSGEVLRPAYTVV